MVIRSLHNANKRNAFSANAKLIWDNEFFGEQNAATNYVFVRVGGAFVNAIVKVHNGTSFVNANVKVRKNNAWQQLN